MTLTEKFANSPITKYYIKRYGSDVTEDVLTDVLLAHSKGFDQGKVVGLNKGIIIGGYTGIVSTMIGVGCGLYIKRKIERS